MIDIRERENRLISKRIAMMNYLNSHPEITNYHIAKEELEDLLFSTNYVLGYDSSWSEKGWSIPGYTNIRELNNDISLNDLDSIKQHGILAKFPVWSGPFLRQMDLSEVDFSHVVWDAEVMFDFPFFWAFDCNLIRYFSYKTVCMDESLTKEPYVDYSHTNVFIDFQTSFNSCLSLENSIFNINLNGVDLSNSNTEDLRVAYYCSFAGTNFKVNPDFFHAHHCDFRGIDLCSYQCCFSSYDYRVHTMQYIYSFEHCHVENSGLLIDVILDPNDIEDKFLRQFAEDVENGYYNGCSIRYRNYYFLSGDKEGFSPRLIK